MAEFEVISESPISIIELKKEIEKIKKRDKELNFRGNRTEEYISQVIVAKKAEGLIEKLAALNIPRLKDNHMKKILDVMPTTVKDLKVVLQGYTVNINSEGLKKIVDAVKEFAEA